MHQWYVLTKHKKSAGANIFATEYGRTLRFSEVQSDYSKDWEGANKCCYSQRYMLMHSKNIKKYPKIAAWMKPCQQKILKTVLPIPKSCNTLQY